MENVLRLLTIEEHAELNRMCALHGVTLAQAVAEGVRAMLSADPEVWQHAKQ